MKSVKFFYTKVSNFFTLRLEEAKKTVIGLR